MPLRFQKPTGSNASFLYAWRREGDRLHIDVPTETPGGVNMDALARRRVSVTNDFVGETGGTVQVRFSFTGVGGGDSRLMMRVPTEDGTGDFTRSVTVDYDLDATGLLVEVELMATSTLKMDGNDITPTGSGSATLLVEQIGNPDGEPTSDLRAEMTVNVHDTNEILLYLPDGGRAPRLELLYNTFWTGGDLIRDRIVSLAPNAFEESSDTISFPFQYFQQVRTQDVDGRYRIGRSKLVNATGMSGGYLATIIINSELDDGTSVDDDDDFDIFFRKYPFAASNTNYRWAGATTSFARVIFNNKQIIVSRNFKELDNGMTFAGVDEVTVSDEMVETRKRLSPEFFLRTTGKISEELSGNLKLSVKRLIQGIFRTIFNNQTDRRENGAWVDITESQTVNGLETERSSVRPAFGRYLSPLYFLMTPPKVIGTYQGNISTTPGAFLQPNTTVTVEQNTGSAPNFLLDESGDTSLPGAFVGTAQPLISIPYKIIPYNTRLDSAAVVHSFTGQSAINAEGFDTQVVLYCIDGPDKDYNRISYKFDFTGTFLRNNLNKFNMTVSGRNRLRGPDLVTRNINPGDSYEDETFDFMNWQKTRDKIFPEIPSFNADDTLIVQQIPGDQIRSLGFASDRSRAFIYAARSYDRATGATTDIPTPDTDAAIRVFLCSVHIDSFYVSPGTVEPAIIDNENTADDELITDTLRFDIILSREAVFGDVWLGTHQVLDPVAYLEGREEDMSSTEYTFRANDTSQPIVMFTQDMSATRQDRTKRMAFEFTTGAISRMKSALEVRGQTVEMFLPIRVGLRVPFPATPTIGEKPPSSLFDLPGTLERRQHIALILVPFTLRTRPPDPDPGPPPEPPEPTPDQPQVRSSVFAAPTILNQFRDDAAYEGSPDPVGPEGFNPFKCAAMNYTARPDASWAQTLTRVDINLPHAPPNSIAYAREWPNQTGNAAANPPLKNLSFSRIWPEDKQGEDIRMRYAGTTRMVPASGMLYWPRPYESACGVRIPPVVDPHTFTGHLTRPVFSLVPGYNEPDSPAPVSGIATIAGPALSRPEGPMHFAVLQRGARTERAFDSREDGESDAAVIARAHPFHATIALAPKKVTLCPDGWNVTARATLRQNLDNEVLGGEPWSAGAFETMPPADAAANVDIALAPASSPSNPESGAHPYWAGLWYQAVATALTEVNDPDRFHIYLRTPSSVTDISSLTARALRRIADGSSTITMPIWSGGRMGTVSGRIARAEELGTIGEHKYWLVTATDGQPAEMICRPGDQYIITTSTTSTLAASAIADPNPERPGLVLAIVAGGTDMSGARVVARDQIPITLNPDNTLSTRTVSWSAVNEYELIETRPVLFAPWLQPIGTRMIVVEFGIRLRKNLPT